MLPIYQAGNDATVAIEYPMAGGEIVTPSSVEYAILDENGSTVLARTAVPNDALSTPAGTITLSVPGSLNQVPDGKTRTMRTVRVFFVLGDGPTIVQTTRYVAEALDKLIVMTNSFQTYDQALLTRLDMPALDGWDNSDEQAQIAAAITAFDNMCRLTYRYRQSDDAPDWGTVDDQRGLYWYVTDMRLRDLDDYATWPDDFRNALNKGQLYEANTILAGDPIGDKRALGIVSETIGESKMFLSNRTPLRHPVGPQTLNVLAPYLYTMNRIGRG